MQLLQFAWSELDTQVLLEAFAERLGGQLGLHVIDVLEEALELGGVVGAVEVRERFGDVLKEIFGLLD